jgi:hypothetical protein
VASLWLLLAPLVPKAKVACATARLPLSREMAINLQSFGGES